MRYLFACIAGHLALFLSRLFGRGSGEQIQGRVIDVLCSQALRIAAQDTRVIIVSATNGKTTTTRLLASALGQVHANVISNALGANQRAGVLAALVSAKKTPGVARWAVLEVDERSLPGMFDELHPELLVLGNLSRDQLDRFGEVSSISQSWKKMLESTSVHVIANGCDPHIVYATSDLPSEQLSYVDLFSRWHDDAHTCPMCGELLHWDAHSHFTSPTCGFTTPTSTMTIDDETRELITDSLFLPGAWNVNNAILAYQAALLCDVESEATLTSWKEVREVAGRNAIFHLDNERSIQLFLAKNPAGWNETLSHLTLSPGDATIFAFNCNIADGKDPSWLYDVDFENAMLDNVVIFGERKTDMQVRLAVAGKTIQLADNFREALGLTSSAKHINLVASYTQFLTLSRVLPKMATPQKVSP